VDFIASISFPPKSTPIYIIITRIKEIKDTKCKGELNIEKNL